jgi:hypothetical protein
MTLASWNIDVALSEDDTHTDATATLHLPDGTDLQAEGHAKRNPADPAQPRIGEEIATARALSSLVDQLLGKAADEIEQVTNEPAHLSA